MADDIRIRARIVDGLTDVRVLMLHPMETGLRKDEAGAFVPAHYITSVRVSTGERTLLQARMTLAVSQDPLLAFRFHGGKVGDPVTVRWIDNHRRHVEAQTLIV
jgi:sulfur-oxidizing protein SoxZ